VNLQIIQTNDGSSSVLNTDLNETYHSIHGAIQESRHVFIKNGLDYTFQYGLRESISIFEVGLGTGLNALLSFEFAIRNRVKINYHSIEYFPIDVMLANQLNYPHHLELENASDYFQQIHSSHWNDMQSLNGYFDLLKIQQDIQSIPLTHSTYDVIYFDAFAPEKQPDMWTLEVLRKVTNALKPNGVFVTYCAKGQLRRDLLSLNLKVEKLAGPPGKREMIRAMRQ
jgi:tRNA U34 5-methylaminomethyl-2-thiouridine-forming methyltransferase MnmC